MNNTQRQFLIKKIQEASKTRIDLLNQSKPECPNLSNYLLHAVMSGKFEIISNEAIKALIVDKALNAVQGSSSWMSATKGRYSAFGGNDQKDLVFRAYDFFVIPEEYKRLYEEYQQKLKEINDEVHEISLQVDTLITRIQLSSDKTLQTMINEVDDMGNISLMDTKLKSITGNSDQNLLK